MFLALLKGFTAGGSLIVAIGAQNAFVIRQGLLRRYLFITALVCATVDAFLIALGVVGFGTIISKYPLTLILAKYFAVIFLFCYGALSFKSAFTQKSLYAAAGESSLRKTVLLLLAFTLLNPHVYLDTVILLGSIATGVPSELKLFFAIGAMSASFLWFFGLTYGSRLLAPLLQDSRAWKVIDCVVGLIMWVIAFTLVF